MQLQSFLLVIQVILSISLISLILIQHGRGAQAGAAFGSGASATVFGARGSASFLTKITTLLAIIFFANSLGLAYLSAIQPEQQSLIDQLNIETSEPAVVEPSLLPSDVPSVEQAENIDPVNAVVGDLEADASTEMPADVPPVE